MTPIPFKISDELLAELRNKIPLNGSNNIGKYAVEIAKMFFLNENSNAQFPKPSKGIDLTVKFDNNQPKHFEIKGTLDNDICFQKLKVSSKHSHDLLKIGTTTLMRITKIGSKEMDIYFMKHGNDFTLKKEVRFMVCKIRK